MDINNRTQTTEIQLILTETTRRLLSDFRQQLLADIRLVFHCNQPSQEKQWLKSNEVRKLLGISHSTLQAMRNKATVPFTKIGGVIYYSRAEIEKMLSRKNPFPP